MKMMRQFFESWMDDAIGQPAAVQLHGDLHRIEICQPVAVQLGKTDANAFMSIGFTHHMLILNRCKTIDERLFYIRRCAAEFWSKRILLRHLR